GEHDVWGMFHSFCFDVSVWEMFGALLNGGKLVVIPAMTARDPGQMLNLLRREQVTVLCQTPSAFYPLSHEEMGRADHGLQIRILIFAGEALAPVQLQAWKEKYSETRLVNMYGPTETTVYVTYKEITAEEIRSNTSNIGRPLPTVSMYVLDGDQQLLPVGIPGELYIGGEGVTRGYLNRPDLTEERFVPNPFVPGERMYRTGDLVRRLPNGELEYLGRMDDQVKIRGYRIELGEIETRLLEHPSVREAVVTARPDQEGSPSLYAYMVLDGLWNVSEMRKHLMKTLPDYMIPSYLVELETLPLTTNGKVDKKALPEPSGYVQTGVRYMAPTNQTEEILVRIWEDVLGVERVGIHDNFFELGGHSLKAMMLLARIHKALKVEVPLQEVFSRPTVEEMASYIKEADTCSYTAIEPVQQRDVYPVSSVQKRLYVIQEFENVGSGYNIPLILEVNGPLHINRLQNAFESLVQRHEALRTSFHFIDGELVQKIHPRVTFNMRQMDSQDGEEVNSLIKSLIQPFDLSEAPLFRSWLIRLGNKRHVLMIDMHHIISDGMSINILLRELVSLYQGKDLSPLRIQYKDYAVWQKGYLQTERLKEQEKYWLSQFSGELPVLELPTDEPRPVVQKFDGDVFTFTLNEELTQKLKQLATEQRATLYMTLLAAYNILLMKYTGQEDVIIGSPIAGRPHTDLERLVGMFVNTLAIRNFPKRNQTFAEFLASVKEQVLGAYQHADYPLEDLVEKLDVRRDLSRNPLFDTLFVMQNMDLSELKIPGLTFKAFDQEWKTAKFDLTWGVTEGKALQIAVEYSTSLFNRMTVQKMAGHFTHILEQIINQPAIRLSEIELVTETEKQQLLVEFNDTEANYPRGKNIHQLFEGQVRKTPDHMAVVFGEERLTYRELNERANQLARALREKGIRRNEFVGLLVERSVEMIVGILGILKAGGAYVPIDPAYPSDRIRYMLEDSGARWLLVQQQVKVPSGYTGEILAIDNRELYRGEGSDVETVNTPHDLIYMIYTSGSTGKPKGVMVEHRNVVRLLFN
ncbi:condensation domain-containing protein, partial [Paenactinomyces guangxiensis]